MSLITRFLRDDSGATAIEYGLIAAGISVAIIATVTSLGGKLVTTFGKVSIASEDAHCHQQRYVHCISMSLGGSTTALRIENPLGRRWRLREL